MSASVRSLILALVVGAGAIGGFFIFKPDQEQSGDSNVQVVSATTSTASARPAENRPVKKRRKARSLYSKVQIRNGKPVGGIKKLKVKKGQKVRFQVSSDTTVPIHVHVFEIEKTAEPGKPAKFNFEATYEGVFEVELHDAAHTGILKLTVTP